MPLNIFLILDFYCMLYYLGVVLLVFKKLKLLYFVIVTLELT